jgi:N-acetyl-gamma-glutamyl-phosphate reductase
VAPFFRGITLTVSMPLAQPMDKEALEARYRDAYGEEPLVHWHGECPQVKAAVGDHGVHLGGLEVDERGQRVVVVATLDNLLKGAATQALQNINLALGHDELMGILS